MVAFHAEQEYPAFRVFGPISSGLALPLLLVETSGR
jgi:hypothetical protein